VPTAAKAAGFRGCILHGFATLARAYEALVRVKGGGVPAGVRMVDVRFVRPLVLPRRTVVCVKDDGVWVGEKAGGEAYLEGRFEVG
jgi:acyl dehydratase